MRRALAGAIAAIALLAAGCGGTNGGGHSLDLMLDFFPNADHAGIYAALADGSFKAHGVSVRVHAPSDPSLPLKLVAAGRTDLAISYEPELLRARDRGAPVVAVAALVRVPLTAIVSLPRGGVRRPADLAGKTVGTAGIDYQTSYLQAILAHAGVPAGRVRRRNVGFDLVPALATGKVDAVLGAYWNYEAVQLRQRGQHPSVIRMEQAGVPTYDELVVVATERTVRERPDLVRRFLAGLADGSRRLAAAPAVQTDRGLLALNRGLDAPLQRASAQLTAPYLVPKRGQPYGYMDPREWSAFTAFMHRNGLLKAATPAGRSPTRSCPQRAASGVAAAHRGRRPVAGQRSAARQQVEARQRRVGRIGREELAHLLLGGPPAEPGEPADQLQVGDVAGGDLVDPPLAVAGELLERPRPDAGDADQARPGAVVVGQVDAARSHLA